jgi:hypothetical protein
VFIHILVAILGCLLAFVALQDGFETIILPRRVARKFRLARLFYAITWSLWSLPMRRKRSGNRREFYLGLFGPLSLIFLLILWAWMIVLGFAGLLWGTLATLNMPVADASFGTYVYMSGTTFVTLGLGDVLPVSALARALVVVEAGTGFAFLALIIGYVPIIYQAFSKREANIALLDARAGSPPCATEMLRRNMPHGDPENVLELLHEWEHWCAELLESHISYPVLAFYRSQHERQSWLAALTTVLDVCALSLAGIEQIPIKPTKFVFAIARHAAVDLSQVIDVTPVRGQDRLPPEVFARVRAALAEKGIMLKDSEATEKRLRQLRRMYEPFVEAIAERLLVSLPPWVPEDGNLDDWQTSAWDHFLESSPRTMDRSIRDE